MNHDKISKKTNWFIIVSLIISCLFLAGGGNAGAVAGNSNLQTRWNLFDKTHPGNQNLQAGFPYMDCFRKTAAEFNLPLPLLLAVARGESDFQAQAKSKKSCYGIMQIRWPGTAGDLGITSLSDLLDPCVNIRAGGQYLRMMLDRYDNNIHLALAAYNYGPGRISSSKAIPSGAAWYSGYIFDHLQYVMTQVKITDDKVDFDIPDYIAQNKIRVIVFNKPALAKNYLEILRKHIPEMTFDWFHMGLGRFQLVMLFNNEQELMWGRQLLGQRMGITGLKS